MLHIYRSSRIERLAQLLHSHLQRWRPRSPLMPHTLIVGHLGMKRWLTLQLAESALPGLPRIAANLDMLLPSEWLDRLAQQVLGTEAIAIAPYRRPALRWRIFEALPGLAIPEVERYLSGDDAPRRRFQLADRLAGLYAQYLVYRRDWLAAWERGEYGAGGWQAQLWQQLVADIRLAHRGQRMQQLAQKLSRLSSDVEQPALFVFGVSHLPPDALGALELLARTREVCVYFPDPCRELWDDLVTRREAYRAELNGGAFLQIGHPLLAALGRMGQHFALLLNQRGSSNDTRDIDDERPEGPLASATPLLLRVQHSVRTLRPEWARGAPADARLDASLRVHRCHTRLRELEVLKDALLERLAADPTLQPRQIVVMAPNMALYAPLLSVVFGPPGRYGGALPWQLADVALMRTHPLLAAFRELLDLPSQRITRAEVLALLALPAVARRLGLDESGHAALARWLERANVVWGLDGEMKRSFGAAAVDANSFSFGMDRICAGVLVGHEAPDWLLDDRFLPTDPVHGPDAACLGPLAELLDLLRAWRDAASRPRSLRHWSERLAEWCARLFRADPDDPEEREAIAAIDKLVAALTLDAGHAGVDPVVEWPVVREVLRQGLEGIPERQVFLAGGITFCGMVPQRAIPFRVIALLGLNDGEYPRARPDTGLDLMQKAPRLGDRDNRMDDRYLFLEALMSARDALHLSYIGEGAQDGKARSAAAPLGELLQFLDEIADLAADDAADRPWLVRHPLQPFDARYFDGSDPRLYSYSTGYAGMQADAGGAPWQFLTDTPLPALAESTLELRALKRFYRDPARWLCENILGLSRRALDDELVNDQEPLTLNRPRRDRSAIDIAWSALADGQATIPIEAPARLLHSGQLVAGALGHLAFAQLRSEAQALLDALRQLPPFAHGSGQAQALSIDWRSDTGVRLVGSIDPVYAHADEHWLVRVETGRSLGFHQWLPLYVEYCVLRLAWPTLRLRLALVHHPNGRTDTTVHCDPAFALGEAPQAAFERLLDGYRRAVHTAGVYFPKTAYSYADALLRKRKLAQQALWDAREAWQGKTDSLGESRYAPGYLQLLGGHAEFLDAGASAHAQFAELATTLYTLIHPPGGSA